MNNNIKLDVIELLKSLSVYESNSTGTQHVVRCPYCGDSTDLTHGHFSIHIDVDSDEPILYRCFKCPASGLLSVNTLNDLGLYPSYESSQAIKSMNRKLKKKNKFITNNNKNFYVPKPSDSILNNQKLDYINNRLATKISFDESSEMKIILDIFEFIKNNEIKTIPNVSSKYLGFINRNYVGFLSTNNNCITFRRINENKELRRYIKILIDPLNINTNSFYSIPNNINLLYTNDINIHVTEGVFDIFGVYYNLTDKNKENNYYYASCGFSYLTIIKYLIYNGINTGLNLHIYSDNDKTDLNHIEYLKKFAIYTWLDSIYIHRNKFKKEKDYGVPAERTIDSYREIKNNIENT